MGEILQLFALATFEEIVEKRGKYLKDYYDEDVEKAIALVEFAFGDKADENLARLGADLRKRNDKLDDRALGIVQLVAMMHEAFIVERKENK